MLSALDHPNVIRTGHSYMKPTTSDILAAIRSGNHPARPTEVPTHGSGSSDDGWTVRRTQSTTSYEKEFSSVDEKQIRRELIEFWRKLAHEVGISCAGKVWNVLAVEATLDFGRIGGTAFVFRDRETRTFDIHAKPCSVNVSLSIPHWETMWLELGDPGEPGGEWEKSATALESSVYDQIQWAATQEPAHAALKQLRTVTPFDIWVQPHDSPESGRFIEI